MTLFEIVFEYDLGEGWTRTSPLNVVAEDSETAIAAASEHHYKVDKKTLTKKELLKIRYRVRSVNPLNEIDIVCGQAQVGQ